MEPYLRTTSIATNKNTNARMAASRVSAKHGGSKHTASSSSSAPVPSKKKETKFHQPHQPLSSISHQLAALQKEAITNAGKFVDDLVDPAGPVVRFPLNSNPTGVSRCKINHEVTDTGYSENGQFMAIATPDPESPLYITNGSAQNYGAGNCPDISGSAYVEMSAGVDSTVWIGFLQVGADRILSPAREDSRNVPAIFRVATSGASASWKFVLSNPSHFIIRPWTRSAGTGAWTASADLQVRPGTNEYVSTLPVGTDAFYTEIVRNPAGVNRNSASTNIAISFVPQPTTSFNITNHVEFLRIINTPSIADYKILRSKLLGMRMMWSFRDAKNYARGNIVTAQYGPGMYHSMFEGASIFSQVKNSKLVKSYSGEVTKGAAVIFTPPSIAALALNAPPQTIATSGYMMIWTDAKSEGAVPALAELNLWYSIEFTTSTTMIDMERPKYSTSAQLEAALSLMSSMVLVGENPHHEMIDAAWRWFKSHALTVLKNPSTYRTLGSIAGAAIALV